MRREEEEKRIWKEYWKRERKGQEYFGDGNKMTEGHDGKRVESIFLFWMRTGHGRMRGTRYGNKEKRCECEGWENRDHVLLYCWNWAKEREDMEEMWKEEGEGEDGWLDMKWLLFGKKGVEGVKKFGRETGWMELRGKERVIWDKGILERKGVSLRNVLEEGRKLSETGEDRRRKLKEKNRMRMRLMRAKGWKEKGRKSKGREVTPIASVTPLGAKAGKNRKVLGVIDGNVRRKDGKV
ncbi:hypothetical protein B9Z19DRAFT_1156984 [Tuber borchii]|uniref:Uncharacterized protein n=1 Tax=Tuber borchii TaxID=42251 RepID=A0A2T6ZGW1_TUBBO|nr:hypothetical protein B9Z19DRAFT_1156984 [Tuber borchii]